MGYPESQVYQVLTDLDFLTSHVIVQRHNHNFEFRVTGQALVEGLEDQVPVTLSQLFQPLQKNNKTKEPVILLALTIHQIVELAPSS